MEETFHPLLDKMTQLRKEKGERVLIYLVAPPGTGKTTLSLLLEKLYKNKDTPFTFQSLAMDGFHHTNDYLNRDFTSINGHRMPLKAIKGKPETFDLKGLKQAINALKRGVPIEWPIYSRSLHDIAEEKLTVDADILLLEGNYLLLNHRGWKELIDHADFTIMLSAPVDLLKKRLLDRKIQGDHSKKDAIAHYNRVDLPNHHLVMNQSLKADWNLVLNEKEEWIME